MRGSCSLITGVAPLQQEEGSPCRGRRKLFFATSTRFFKEVVMVNLVRRVDGGLCDGSSGSIEPASLI